MDSGCNCTYFQTLGGAGMIVDIFNTDNKYQIIYVDPLWSYKTWSGKGKEKKSAENHYNCMKKEDIQNLPISNICDKNCILFLWVTFPCLEEGLELIKKWNFKYKTCGFVWVKKNKKADTYFTGLGYYTRANAELCLIATKGTIKRMSKSVKQVCDARIQEHSKKPDEIRNRITDLVGDLPIIELFARQEADGWDCWGKEV